MLDLPSFWTLMPGVISGLLFVGRVARWLQFVRGTMGKPTGSFSVNPEPRTWKTVAAVVVYPTPWIALGLILWAVHHLVAAPITNEWRWFYAGFFGGPLLIGFYLYRKVSRLRAKKASHLQ
jgi:hypothetical protein